MIHSFRTGLVAAVLCSTAASAQERPLLEPGARVRLTMTAFVDGVAMWRTPLPRAGRLASVDSGSITVRMDDDGTTFTAPLGNLRRLEVSRGTMPSAQGQRRGMQRGALIGGGFVLATATAYYLVNRGSQRVERSNCDFELIDCDEVSDPSFVDWERVALYAGGGAATGALIGVALGSRTQERWETVDLRSLPGASRAVRLQVGVTTRF